MNTILRTNTDYSIYNLGSHLFINLCPFWVNKCISRIAHLNDEGQSRAYTFKCNDNSSVTISLIELIKDQYIYNSFIKGTEYEDVAFSLLFGGGGGGGDE